MLSAWDTGPQRRKELTKKMVSLQGRRWPGKASWKAHIERREPDASEKAGKGTGRREPGVADPVGPPVTWAITEHRAAR